MADDELATRAPESDLAEQSFLPGDSAVDQGPSLGVSIRRVDAIATKLTAVKNEEAQVHEAGRKPFPLCVSQLYADRSTQKQHPPPKPQPAKSQSSTR
jgi:hypothetical protein